jgi:hypothetical protein
MPLPFIRITNLGFSNLSLVGDSGTPRVNIQKQGSTKNYEDVTIASISGDALAISTLNSWVDSNMVRVSRDGVVLNSNQISELGVGLVDETWGDIAWYIDPVTGNDATGDGSAAYPYKSFACLDNIPRVVKHEIRIRPKAGTYSYFPELVFHEYFGNGRIIIDASAEIFPVSEGPLTIQTRTGVGDTSPEGYTIGVDLQVSGAPGWTNDEHWPKFVHMTSGSYAGYIFPIFKNTSDTVTITADWGGTSATNTFNIVDCPVQITVPNEVIIRGNMEGAYQAEDYDAESPYKVSFVMCGVSINANGTRQARRPFRIEKVVSVLSFCSLVNDWTAGSFDAETLELEKSSVNAHPLDSGTLDNSALADWYVYAIQVSRSSGPSAATLPIVNLSDGCLAMACVRGAVWCNAVVGSATGGFLVYSICGSLASFTRGSVMMRHVLIDQLGSYSAAISTNASMLDILSCYVRDAGQTLVADHGSYVRSRWLRGTTANATYAVELGVNCFVSADVANFPTSGTDVLGSTGAITFGFSGTNHATWPGTGASYTDSSGSYVAEE